MLVSAIVKKPRYVAECSFPSKNIVVLSKQKYKFQFHCCIFKNSFYTYLSKTKNGNAKTMCEICSKLTKKTQERCNNQMPTVKMITNCENVMLIKFLKNSTEVSPFGVWDFGRFSCFGICMAAMSYNTGVIKTTFTGRSLCKLVMLIILWQFLHFTQVLECIFFPNKTYIGLTFPLDTGREFNSHETFRKCPGRLWNVLCILNLRSMIKDLQTW